MIKIFHFLVVASILAACTSDLEKAKKLGFTDVNQMKYLIEQGYSNYEEFKKTHGFQTDSESTKFAEIELGLYAVFFGERKKSEKTEFNDYFISPKSVTMYVDNQDKVSVIKYSCISSKQTSDASVGGISCKSNRPDVLNSIKDSIEYCHYNDEDKSVILKNNSFFEIDRSTSKVLGFGLTKSIQSYYYPGTFFDKCDIVAENTKASKLAGFEKVTDMLIAKGKGIKTGSAWRLEEWRMDLEDKYQTANNALEKALIVMVSTPEDFQAHRDDGGLNTMNSWRGYKISLAEVEYKSKILNFIHLAVRTDHTNKEKPATFNNLKRDLLDECGSIWDSRGRSDVYWSDSDFATCEISEASRSGYNVVISVK